MRSLMRSGFIFITVLGLIDCGQIYAGMANTSGPSTGLADPISGHWNVTFKLEDMSVTGDFNLKLANDGAVSGTVHTDHTGLGTLKDGKWASGKLSFTAEFAAHDSIAITAELKDGKLIGEFATEGRTGKWEGTRVKNISPTIANND